VVDLVHTWRAFPRRDPELPTELLPDGWSGARAADLFQRQHTKWSPAATTEWQRITDAAKA
jgi:phenylacetic acid degradation operon negative regulatory protein